MCIDIFYKLFFLGGRELFDWLLNFNEGLNFYLNFYSLGLKINLYTFPANWAFRSLILQILATSIANTHMFAWCNNHVERFC